MPLLAPLPLEVTEVPLSAAELEAPWKEAAVGLWAAEEKYP